MRVDILELEICETTGLLPVSHHNKQQTELKRAGLLLSVNLENKT